MRTAYLVYCANLPGFPHFPEASLALASELKKIGVPARIIDLRLIKEGAINIREPLFFGFTIYSNESIKYALDFAARIRRDLPGVTLAWGGPHAHMLPEQTAGNELVDLVCYGEGEASVRELARQLSEGRKDFSKIPGVVFREGGQTCKTALEGYKSLDELEFYPYELLDLSLYKKTAGTHFYYQTSRGCIHRCRFCNYNYQSRWRGKSSQKVALELRRIKESFNPYEFYISDGNFFAVKKRALEIILEFKKLGIRWSAFCRFDDLASFSDEELALIKDSGCLKLNLGGESGSDMILQYLNKGISSRQILEGISRCNLYGILADVSFIAGVPKETNDELNETIDIILKIYRMHPDNMVNGLFYYQPYPNTPLMEEIMSSYNLPLPRDLAGWGDKPITSPYREYLPWLSDKEYAKIFSLTQIVNFLYLRKRLEIYLRNGILDKRYKLLLKLSGLLLPLVKLRLKKRVFSCPYEWTLYYMFKKGFLNMDL